jgi:DNA-binding CsgD family transcriptional regulator
VELLDFITGSTEAETTEELNTLLGRALHDICGLTRYNFGLETDHHTIGLSAGHGLMCNYPLDWMTHYAAKGFANIDPVRRFGHAANSAFAWSDIPPVYLITKRARDCMSGGEEAGLKYGACVALRGPFGQLAGIAAASDTDPDCADKQKLAEFNIIAQQFYRCFVELHKPDAPSTPLPVLAPREKDIISWVARGKTNGEISDILGLSSSHVRDVLSNVMRKYNASSRGSAVLMAIFNGEIDASDLIVPPRRKPRLA